MKETYYITNMRTGHVIAQAHNPYAATLSINWILSNGYGRLWDLAVTTGNGTYKDGCDFINEYPI